ncbi:hypothetical protein FIV46_17755 [Emcibacter nanhaiensis]|uniref:Uncharacterized protein n=1 Tax=Emcibacter nanhaiensis TaxID=1505037 RepID=A0A501PC06_9PROT|nr:hypothetical protein FIV46_17755 [Emcibacter nanhaiensis]
MLNSRILLENCHLPGEIRSLIRELITQHNIRMYHENLNNQTPEDVWLGRGTEILEMREEIKQKIRVMRKNVHRKA